MRKVPSVAVTKRLIPWSKDFLDEVEWLRWSSDVDALEDAIRMARTILVQHPKDRISHVMIAGAALERLFEIVKDSGHTWDAYLRSRGWAPKTTNNFRRVYRYWHRADLMEQLRISELGVGEVLDRIRGFRRKPLRNQNNHARKRAPESSRAHEEREVIPPSKNVQSVAGTPRSRSLFRSIIGLLGFRRR